MFVVSQGKEMANSDGNYTWDIGLCEPGDFGACCFACCCPREWMYFPIYVDDLLRSHQNALLLLLEQIWMAPVFVLISFVSISASRHFSFKVRMELIKIVRLTCSSSVAAHAVL